MPTRTVVFGELSTRSELASELCIPVAAIGIVLLPLATCKKPDCPLSEAEGNHGQYILCSQSWYLCEVDRKGKLATNWRRYGPFGPQFLRTYRGGSKTNQSCCCTSPLCEKLGYSNHGMMRLPSDPIDCASAVRAMGIPASEQQRIVDNRHNFHVAPWHFYKRHRFRDGDGN